MNKQKVRKPYLRYSPISNQSMCSLLTSSTILSFPKQGIKNIGTTYYAIEDEIQACRCLYFFLAKHPGKKEKEQQCTPVVSYLFILRILHFSIFVLLCSLDDNLLVQHIENPSVTFLLLQCKIYLFTNVKTVVAFYARYHNNNMIYQK